MSNNCSMFMYVCQVFVRGTFRIFCVLVNLSAFQLLSVSPTSGGNLGPMPSTCFWLVESQVAELWRAVYLLRRPTCLVDRLRNWSIAPGSRKRLLMGIFIGILFCGGSSTKVVAGSISIIHDKPHLLCHRTAQALFAPEDQQLDLSVWLFNFQMLGAQNAGSCGILVNDCIKRC